MPPVHRTPNPERPALGHALRSVRLGRHGVQHAINRSTTAFRASRFGSWGDIKRIDQDPAIRRKKILVVHHLDRQRMSSGSQATYREVGVLGSLRPEVRIEV